MEYKLLRLKPQLTRLRKRMTENNHTCILDTSVRHSPPGKEPPVSCKHYTMANTKRKRKSYVKTSNSLIKYRTPLLAVCLFSVLSVRVYSRPCERERKKVVRKRRGWVTPSRPSLFSSRGASQTFAPYTYRETKDCSCRFLISKRACLHTENEQRNP